MAAELDIGDVRVEFIADYVLKTLRIKGDKWTKMYVNEDNKNMCLEFFDKPDAPILVLALNASGALGVSTEWPAQFKQKAVRLLVIFLRLSKCKMYNVVVVSTAASCNMQ